MSDLHRFNLATTWRAEMRLMFPRVTEAELDQLGALIATDRFVTDAGDPHPDLIEWVSRVGRFSGGTAPAPAPVFPQPKTGPAGAEVTL